MWGGQVMGRLGVWAGFRAATGATGRAVCHREFDRAKLIGQLEAWMSEFAVVR